MSAAAGQKPTSESETPTTVREPTTAREESFVRVPTPTREEPTIEIGVLLIAGGDGASQALAVELGERLSPAHVVHAQTVGEALSVGIGGMDCIVLDLASLDGYSGIEAVRHVRSGISDYVPLVVLLDGPDDTTGQAAMRFGAQGYLAKGAMQPGQLARTVRGIVKHQQIEMAEHELSLAQARAREAVRLERGLSPQPLLRDDSIRVASVYKPGRSRALLGGDFFDLVQLDERRVRLVVGDVCGHGPDEAAVGVSLRAAWRALAISATPMVPAVHTLESIFVQERHLPGLFVTLCTVDLDLAERGAEVLIAGHPRPLLIHEDAAQPLALGGGRAIGIGEGEWSTERVVLPRGWTILCYTDGLIEGRTGSGPERLGEGGIRSVVTEQMKLRPGWSGQARELLNDIVDATEAINRGPLSDDIAMLLMGERGPRERS
jgi:serine phosphatase RsbU (regulator of sigma subunit)